MTHRDRASDPSGQGRRAGRRVRGLERRRDPEAGQDHDRGAEGLRPQPAGRALGRVILIRPQMAGPGSLCKLLKVWQVLRSPPIRSVGGVSKTCLDILLRAAVQAALSTATFSTATRAPSLAMVRSSSLTQA